MPVAAPACHIEGPRRVRGEVDARGRVTLRPLLVRCTARGRSWSASAGHRRLVRLRGVRFSLPARSASRIRLGGHVSRAGVLGRRRSSCACARTESRRFEVILRAHPPEGAGRGRRSVRGYVRGPAVHPASGADRPAGRPLGRDARRRGRGVADRGAASGVHRWWRSAWGAAIAAPSTVPAAELARVYGPFRAFRASWVRLITPWNEPNHDSQPTAGLRAGRRGTTRRAHRLPLLHDCSRRLPTRRT